MKSSHSSTFSQNSVQSSLNESENNAKLKSNAHRCFTHHNIKSM